MARIDEHTKQFMDAVADSDAQPSGGISLKPIRLMKQMSKGIDNPQKALGKLLVRGTLNEVLDKEGAVNVIDLYGFLNDHYARLWWDWEPETIWAELQRDHFTGGAPEEIKDAVMALQLTVNSHAPFEEWHVFEKVGHAFCFNHVDFTIVQPLEPTEAALTMALLGKIRPQEKYDHEVLMYVAVCAKSAGMVWLPEEMFPGVQPCLDDINYDVTLRDSVIKAYKEKNSSDLSAAVEIQLARIKETEQFVRKGLKGA